MSKISRLYIELLKDLHVKSLNQFVERFYQRMARDRFEGILRAYNITPEQHKEKYVLEALRNIDQEPADNETQDNRPSIPFQKSVTTTEQYHPSDLTSVDDTISKLETKLGGELDGKKRESLSLRLSRKKEEKRLLLQIVKDTDPLDRETVNPASH